MSTDAKEAMSNDAKDAEIARLNSVINDWRIFFAYRLMRGWPSGGWGPAPSPETIHAVLERLKGQRPFQHLHSPEKR